MPRPIRAGGSVTQVVFLTDFADLAVLLPLTGLVALSLAAVGRQREALAWCLAVSGTFVTMLLLKLLVLVGIGPDAWAGLNNPSGHTAAGVVVYAGLLTLFAERFAPRIPIALLAGAVFGLLFGCTRLMLRVHTVPDVFVGAMVGLAGVLVLGAAGRAAAARCPGIRAGGGRGGGAVRHADLPRPQAACRSGNPVDRGGDPLGRAIVTGCPFGRAAPRFPAKARPKGDRHHAR